MPQILAEDAATAVSQPGLWVFAGGLALCQTDTALEIPGMAYGLAHGLTGMILQTRPPSRRVSQQRGLFIDSPLNSPWMPRSHIPEEFTCLEVEGRSRPGPFMQEEPVSSM